MKKLLVIISILSICFSCKQKTETIQPEKAISTAEKIANAHGFENWGNVSEIQFTFNKNRHWIWKPKTNDVSLIRKKDTLNYNRKHIDSLSKKADRAFINDKFWLLIPFQLVWDSGITISESTKEIAPISKNEMNKITLLYGSEGGYTPGDAYDIYFDDSYIIKEWGFRKGNKPKAGLTNTFENYQDFNGIKIALDHKKAEGDWNLTLSDIKIKTN
ncbi:hypothetical protein DIS18_13675 [Algibacter marinivivus]|uniref:Uncharacterized protein n=1 Tax=Algibacter marinivivus TaxID=2100723 RepID=A0A2U2X1R6_9FLAO|nr:hypothetical protein [Algibacter marinivivus]PWH81725.1 hypothetical protein DIS18_13675 [Algibacter marinivivus]